MKSIVSVAMMCVVFGNLAQANQLTCYEQHYNSVPFELRKQQAQAVDRTEKYIQYSVLPVIAASGVAGFMLIKTAFPYQDTVSNLSTAATAAGVGSAIVAGFGEIIMSTVNSESMELEKIRQLSDEAYLGAGETLNAESEKIASQLNQAARNARLTQTYNRDLVKKSLIEVLTKSPELCAAQDPSVVRTNLLNATVVKYNQLMTGLSRKRD